MLYDTVKKLWYDSVQDTLLPVGRNPRLPMDVILSTYDRNNYEKPDYQKYTKE